MLNQTQRPIAPEVWSNPQSLVSYVQDAKKNLLNIIPPSAFTQGHTTFPSHFGDTHYISDPDILREILKTRVEDFPKSRGMTVLLEPLVPDSMFIVHGDKWKSMHKTMMPVFNRRNIESFAPDIEALAYHSLASLKTSEEPVDVIPIMQELTFQVISSVIIGQNEQSEFSQLRVMFEEFLNTSGRISVLDIPKIFFGHFPNYRNFRYHGQISRFRALCEVIIRKRLKCEAGAHQDFLEYLIEAYGLRADPSRERRYEVEDNILTFLIAGHETTAMLLSWGLYAISFFPDAQQQIVNEAQLPWNERAFTDAFLKEVLRLYPPAALLSRTTTCDENIKGLVMKKNEGVLIPILAIQRHQAYWERPDEFWPDRFMETEPLPMTYMPFGAGPRVCIGQSFATMEANILFPIILSRFTIKQSQQIPKPELILTLRSSNGIRLQLKAN